MNNNRATFFFSGYRWIITGVVSGLISYLFFGAIIPQLFDEPIVERSLLYGIIYWSLFGIGFIGLTKVGVEIGYKGKRWIFQGLLWGFSMFAMMLLAVPYFESGENSLVDWLRQYSEDKEEQFVINLDGSKATLDNVVLDEKSKTLSNSLLLDLKHKERLLSDSEELTSDGNLWKIFVLGFLGGLVALLTPCVFPMIPLTVSFFTKKNGQNKSCGVSKALLYGFFIFAVYIILSIPFHLLDSVNPDILNEISTNIWLNIIFFIIFVFFAFSFFGYYELTLPASWTNKTTQGESSGGFIGIFFMALTLAIVSFSCTGPILGSLLAGSLTADGGAWQLTSGMAGFGVSLGLPFALFALFPSWLNSLPKNKTKALHKKNYS